MAKVILMIVGSIVVVGGGYMLLATNKADAPAVTSDAIDVQQAREAETLNQIGQGALADLFTSGQSVRCTFSSEDTQGSATGEFWYHQNKYRVESTYALDGATYETNMIGTVATNYIWGTGPEGAMAIMIPAETSDGTLEPVAWDDNQPTQGFDVTADVSYDCASWRAEAGMFTPPSDIEFMDMQAMFETMMQNGGVALPEGLELPY